MDTGAGEEQPQLRAAPGARPTLEHTTSKQSIEAIEERNSYPSPLLRQASSESNEQLLNSNNTHRYSTPPSSPPPPSPPPAQAGLEPVTTDYNEGNGFMPSTQAMMQRMQEGTDNGEPMESRAVENNGSNQGIRRKPIGSPSARYSDAANGRYSAIGSPPTPGVDDTPYIRFALDQLTRDEEVRGTRMYPAGAPAVEPMDPDTQRDLDVERYTTPAERPPYSPSFYEETSNQPDVFVPFDHEVSPLRFLPGILKPLPLGAFIVLCLFMVAALLVSGIWSGVRAGLYNYVEFGGSRYFIFQYLPTLIGMVYLIWVIQIQIAVQRIAPFIALASDSLNSRTAAPLMEMLPTSFLRPKLFYFRAGQPILGFCMLIFWIQIFTIPLFATVYNADFYGDTAIGAWRWDTVQSIVWTLFAFYFLLVAALVLLGVWLWRQRTGLKWDPRSIADIIALLDRSNIVADFVDSETFVGPPEFRDRLAGRADRLGYWTTSLKPNDIFYGIGEEGGITKRYSVESGHLREKAPERQHPYGYYTSRPSMNDPEAADKFDRAQHRWLPWFLRPSLVLLWCVAAIFLFLAFIIVSFVNDAITHGFNPMLHVRADAAGFSATNFVYSFIPTVIAQFLFLSWLNVDYAFRRLQPYARMSAAHGQGATATTSLLLDYPARLPISATLSAIVTQCPRVAWFSFMSLIAACIPVLAGGCFWAQYYQVPNQVRVSAETSGFYALCVFLALYTFSIPLIFIRLRQAGLPHDCSTLAEVMSWLYASGVLGEREWRAPLGSKTEMVTRLISPATELERTGAGRGGEGRFIFGRFTGKDGRPHLGIERIGRGNGATSAKPAVPRVWRHDTMAREKELPPAPPRVPEMAQTNPRSSWRTTGSGARIFGLRRSREEITMTAKGPTNGNGTTRQPID